jgi:hypothetical protein
MRLLLKGFLIGVGALIALVAVYVSVLLFILPSDVVTRHYPTLSDARKDELFRRGWLPDILPASAHSIETENNLDLNISAGEFSFAAAEYETFVAQLLPYGPSMDWPSNPFNEEVSKMRRRGFHLGVFVDDTSAWVFLCRQDRGYCEYYMWLLREGSTK